MRLLDRTIARVDETQRAHRALAFPVAVWKKFGEDSAGNLAALIAYYGFFSFFPLLLVLVTVMGFVLRGNASAQHAVLHSTLSRFPVIGDQIQQNGVHSLKGSGLALAIGIAGTLWAGLGGIRAFQNAMDSIWTVPRAQRPNFVKSVMRSTLMLAVLGAGTVLAAVLSGIGGSGRVAWWIAAGGTIASLLLNLGVFAFAFKMLTAAPVSWKDILPGAAVAATAWAILQSVGGYYVDHQLKNASQVYGLFATVIGLLAWLYLGAQITLLAAEVNVVRVQRLWPRSLRGLTPQDERALAAQAEEERRRPDERVRAEFEGRESA